MLAVLGPGPAEAVRALDPRQAARELRAFKHRWNDGRDVACLLFFLRQMLESHGSVEAFFAEGLEAGAADVGPALTSFSARASRLDHGGLYGSGRPARGGGRALLLPLARRRQRLQAAEPLPSLDGPPGRSGPRSVEVASPAALVIPIDAHIYTIAAACGSPATRLPGWKMALDITRRLRRFDPADPVKYDFAFHRMGLFKKDEEIRSLSR